MDLENTTRSGWIFRSIHVRRLTKSGSDVSVDIERLLSSNSNTDVRGDRLTGPRGSDRNAAVVWQENRQDRESGEQRKVLRRGSSGGGLPPDEDEDDDCFGFKATPPRGECVGVKGAGLSIFDEKWRDKEVGDVDESSGPRTDGGVEPVTPGIYPVTPGI